MYLEIVKAIIFFGLGTYFYSRVLDKPETINKIKRLKQKKGTGNIMNVKDKETPSDRIYSTDTRRIVIKKWRELKKMNIN